MAASPSRERHLCLAQERCQGWQGEKHETVFFGEQSVGAAVAKGSVLLVCQAGSSPVLHATLTAQHTPPVNLLLHRDFWMRAILCSVHTPTTTEVHVWPERNTHTLEACKGCVNFLASLCLPCSTIIGNAEYEELWGVGCWMAWAGLVSGCRLSLLIKQVNSAIFCTWILFRVCFNLKYF